MSEPTDTELLDWLQEQTDKVVYTGTVLFRWSGNFRGWRLHETGDSRAVPTVREAIHNAMLAPEETDDAQNP